MIEGLNTVSFSIALDIIVAVLLAITIGYGVVLNRKLGNLRNFKSELESLSAKFGDATARADDSVGKLKKTATGLQGNMDKARSLRDDLVFLIDRGNATADRLEGVVRDARKESPAFPEAVPEEMPEDSAQVNGGSEEDKGELLPRSNAERELLKALQSAR